MCHCGAEYCRGVIGGRPAQRLNGLMHDKDQGKDKSKRKSKKQRNREKDKVSFLEQSVSIYLLLIQVINLCSWYMYIPNVNYHF